MKNISSQVDVRTSYLVLTSQIFCPLNHAYL